MHELLIQKSYFEWLGDCVCNETAIPYDYSRLFHTLHGMGFYPLLTLDENRVDDGINLRYRFGHESRMEQVLVFHALDIRECSVFEMLVALALRCEDHIMYEPCIGDRTSIWFFTMLKNLGLDTMKDSCFDETYVNDCIHRFLERKYNPNGVGGLFVINKKNVDMRKIDIWYQMNLYLSENFN
ncbi:MAG: hypothetical protein R3Y53_01900 [Bacillota bacterium]